MGSSIDGSSFSGANTLEAGTERDTLSRQSSLGESRKPTGDQSNEGRDLRKNNQVATSAQQIDEQKHEKLTKNFNKKSNILDKIKDTFSRVAGIFYENIKYWLNPNTIVDPI